jgi:hypothetical protein
MRRALTFLAVTGWLGVHAFLWTLLPPLPRITFDRPPFAVFLGDGKSIAFLSNERIDVCDLDSGKTIREWTNPTGGTDIAAIYAGAKRGHVLLLDRTREIPFLINLETGTHTQLPRRRQNPLFGGWTHANWFQVTRDGKTIIYPTQTETGDGYELCVWDIEVGAGRTIPMSLLEPAPPPPSRLGETDVVAISPDGGTAAVFVHAPYCSLHLIDIRTGAARGRWLLGRRIHTLLFSPDGQSLAIGYLRDSPGPLCVLNEVWDVNAGRPQTTINAGQVTCWCLDGSLLVLDGNELRTVDGHTGQPAGNAVASISSRDFVLATLQGEGRYLTVMERWRWPGYVERIGRWLPRSLFDPNQMSGRTRMLDLANGQIVADVPIACNAASDGRMLRSVDFDNRTRIYDVPPRYPRGIVLGLMIAEVGLLIAWTAWRRRRARRLRCAAR